MKRFAIFLALIMALAVMPCVAEENPEYPPFEDVARMSDADFFGSWNAEIQQWEVEPSIDYTFSDELSATENFAKQGRYPEAKEALLHYYRNRSYPRPNFSAGRDPLMAEMGDRNIFVMENTPLDKVVVEDDTLKQYSIQVSPEQYSFMFFAEDKSENTAFIMSRESEYPPVLEIVQKNKKSYLPVAKDVYVSAGENSTKNYGSDTQLLVCDRGNPVDETTCIPYMVFDASGIDRTVAIDSATLKFYAKTDGGAKSLYLILSSENMWAEDTAAFENISGRVYSWNGIEGGFDWKRPSYAHTEFLNVALRLIFLDSMVSEYVNTRNEHYAYRSLEQFLDFIAENGGLMYDTETRLVVKSLNAGFRGTAAVGAFFGLLESPSMNANAATAILKYMCDESEALSMDIHFQESHNAGNYELTTLMTMTTYFPEFKRNSVWREIVSHRLDRLAEVLVRDDGSYIEATSGYSTGVLGSFTRFYELAQISGMEVSPYFSEKYLKFARYMMGIERPDGKEPDWGDGTNSTLAKYLLQAAQVTDDQNLYYAGTRGERGTAPDFTSVYYPDGKLAIMRTGWEKDDAYTFIIGRLGGSHSHLHNMHMSIYAYGRYLLTDTGMTSYDPVHPNFLWQRENNISHNFIQIDDTPPPKIFDESGVSLSDGNMYSNNLFDYYKGSSSQYKNFKQYRNVMFLKNPRIWIVSDSVVPTDEEIHKYNLNWHTAANTHITMDEAGVVQTNYSSGANLKILPVVDDGLNISLEDGVSIVDSPRNTAETKYTSYVKNVQGAVSFDTVITAYTRNKAADMSITRIPMSVSPDVASAFAVNNDTEKTNIYYYISHERDPLERRFGTYGTNGRVAVIEHDKNGNLSMFAAVETETLTDDGEIIMEAPSVLQDIAVTYGGTAVEVETSAVPADDNVLKIYAPNAKMLLFNGEENAFERQDEYILISKIEKPLPAEDETEDSEEDGSDESGSGGGFGGGSGSGGGFGGGSGSGGGGGPIRGSGSISSSGVTGGAISPIVPQEQVFKDVIGHWASNDISFLFEKGIITGISDDTFEPERKVTRAEFAVMLARLLNLELSEFKGLYDDVSEDKWYALQVEAVSEKGLVCGFDGLFNPESSLSREEMAKMAVISYRQSASSDVAEKPTEFTDYELISEWAREYVDAAVVNGLFAGMGDGSFAPKSSVTRAQAAAVLRRLYTVE